MTIEQRAKENANKNGYTDKTWHASVGSYMLGATEQKRIDVNKACEWIKRFSGTSISFGQKFYLIDIEHFRKGMEE